MQGIFLLCAHWPVGLRRHIHSRQHRIVHRLGRVTLGCDHGGVHGRHFATGQHRVFVPPDGDTPRVDRVGQRGALRQGAANPRHGDGRALLDRAGDLVEVCRHLTE
ncbi:hypothetical protein D3C72_1382450 [compost metagenome]